MRPLNLGETLDASIKIVRSRWKTLATVMLVIALPIQLANIIIIKSTTDVYQIGTSFSSTAETATTYSDEGAYVAGQTLMIALSFLGYLLGTVACYRAIADTYLGRETSARASLRYRRRAPRRHAVADDRARRSGLVLGFLALLVPGIWLYIAWAVAYPVMLVEGTGGVAALKRSFKLVETRWWATAGRMAVTFILVGVVTVGRDAAVPRAHGVVHRRHVLRCAHPGARGQLGGVARDDAVRGGRDHVGVLRPAGAQGGLRPRAAGRAHGRAATPAAAGGAHAAPAPSVPPPLWSSEREGGRDAFGRPVAPRGAPAPYAPPVAPAPPARPRPPAPDRGRPRWRPSRSGRRRRTSDLRRARRRFERDEKVRPVSDSGC